MTVLFCLVAGGGLGPAALAPTMVEPTGSTRKPAGSAVERTGSTPEPAGHIVEPTGSTLEPAGPTIEPVRYTFETEPDLRQDVTNFPQVWILHFR